MTKTITEVKTITRECCDYDDLHCINPKEGRRNKIYVCTHCKDKWQWHRGLDASGNWDWDLVKLKKGD